MRENRELREMGKSWEVEIAPELDGLVGLGTHREVQCGCAVLGDSPYWDGVMSRESGVGSPEKNCSEFRVVISRVGLL